MKLEFINRYPVERVAQCYIEHKIWKHSHPNHRLYEADIVEYLHAKKETFLACIPLHSRTIVEQHYLTRCQSACKLKNPALLFSREKWIEILNSSIKKCYGDLPHTRNNIQANHIIEIWGKNEVRVSWDVSVSEDGTPHIYIHSINAELRQKGRATSLITAFIEALQRYPFPYAEIKLNAYSNGSYIGAFTWARLGFDATRLNQRNETKHPAVIYSEMNLLRSQVIESIADTRLLAAFFRYSNVDDHPYPAKFIIQILSKLKRCKHPWEIARLQIDGLAIGKFLLCQRISYIGKLWPNSPHSRGMVQYYGRIEEVKKTSSSRTK